MIHDLTRRHLLRSCTIRQVAQACMCVNASKFVSKFALTNLIINTMTHDHTVYFHSTIASGTSDFVSIFESKFALTLNHQHDDTRLNTKAFATLMQPSGRPAQACVCVNVSKFESKFALTRKISTVDFKLSTR